MNSFLNKNKVDILRKNESYKEALVLYVEAATILETRIGNRLLSGICLIAGVKSWLNMHLDNSDPFLDDYIQDCEIKDVKIYLQFLKKLITKQKLFQYWKMPILPWQNRRGYSHDGDCLPEREESSRCRCQC